MVSSVGQAPYPDAMKRHDTSDDNAFENDAVWKLLDQAPPASPSGRFVDDTVRAARLSRAEQPWTKRAWALATFSTGLLGATAAIVMSLFVNTDHQLPTVATSHQAEEIQEIAETETLIAAADHLDQFSDTELVTLIGF